MNDSQLITNNEICDHPAKFQTNEKSPENLPASYSLYQNIFDNLDDAVFIVDVNGMIEEVNHAACSKCGYSRDEFLTMSFFDTIPNSVRNNFQQDFKQIISEGATTIETILTTKSNKKYHVKLNAKRFENGTKESALIFVKDIITKKKHKNTLEKEKTLFRVLMDNIPDRIYFKDINSKFILVNKAHSKNFGFLDPSEIIGHCDHDYFDKKHADEALLDEQQIISSQKSIISKIEREKVLSQNHDYEWVNTTKVPIINKKGKVSGIVGITRDVTELKNAENKILKYAKELQYLNSSKDKFLSILAHDLKNPFFSLLGYAEMLEKSYEEFTDEERLEYVHNIISISRRSYQLLENLLEWARSQNGRIEYQPATFDLSKLVKDALYLINPLAKNKKIEILNGIENSLDAYADTNMIRTIIRNLVTNALKFTDPGGTIKLNAEESKNNIKVIVQDNGRGMDSDSLQKLFRTDVNHKSLGTLNEEGTGLGLIICKEFVEKNGGQINVESEPGKGSKFIFTIPKH